jgi:glutamine amidotransferase PdxT
MAPPSDEKAKPLIGVLALQGAFEEHQACLEAVGCRTVQVGTFRLARTSV